MSVRLKLFEGVKFIRSICSLDIVEAKALAYHVTQDRGFCHRCHSPVTQEVSTCQKCKSVNLNW